MGDVMGTLKRDGHTCLDPETIAAFIDGKLAGAERARVLEHVADCADCYFVFSESARAAAAVAAEAADKPGIFRAIATTLARPRVKWSSFAGLAAAAALIVAVAGPWRSSSADLRPLVAAVGTERTFEPRLTGGFAYGPVRTTRSGNDTPIAPLDVRLAAAQIEKRAQTLRTPEMLRALGISYLVLGDATRAVPPLEEAADRRVPDPQVLSDLAAAYLVRGSRTNNPQDYVNALSAADRAVKASPGLVEAWFNRALAVTLVSPGPEAKHAWEDYVRSDPGSPWVSEAYTHIHQLDSTR